MMGLRLMNLMNGDYVLICSKASVKAVLLHNCNIHLSILVHTIIAHAIKLKQTSNASAVERV